MDFDDDIRRKIIFVDDVKYTLLTVKDRLKTHYEVFPAESVEMMFELLEEIIPELILLDVNMPDIDGYEAITRLKSDMRYNAIPVIFLTGKDDKESVVKGLRLGAADYVTKPFSDPELIECIEFQLNPEKREANKPIILAIDDNPSILKTINFLLHDKYVVYTLPEPEKMMTLLSIIMPDLFLLDCNMPILSGFDLVNIIREIPEHKNTPILFLTSEGSIDNVSVAIHLGVCDFIVKPIDEVILCDRIAAHLEDFVMRRRIRSL